MKLEVYYNNNFDIFLNNKYLSGLDLSNKDDVISYIKNFFLNNKRKFNLCGFYKVLVYCHEMIGIFINLIKIEDCYNNDNIDLRFVVNLNSDIYFKTDDYFIIRDCNSIRYYNGYFYCLIDNLCGSIINYCELGDFIYGSNVKDLIDKSTYL